jgi:hypothetical protein
VILFKNNSIKSLTFIKLFLYLYIKSLVMPQIVKIEKDGIVLNKEFRFTFQPKDPEQFGGRKRFSVGVGQLHKYVGEDNAMTVIEKAFESPEDRGRIKFRVRGWIDFYCK